LHEYVQVFLTLCSYFRSLLLEITTN
jgi:hypothetical protein